VKNALYEAYFMESWANSRACQVTVRSVYIYEIESLYSACCEPLSQIVPKK